MSWFFHIQVEYNPWVSGLHLGGWSRCLGSCLSRECICLMALESAHFYFGAGNTSLFASCGFRDAVSCSHVLKLTLRPWLKSVNHLEGQVSSVIILSFPIILIAPITHWSKAYFWCYWKYCLGKGPTFLVKLSSGPGPSGTLWASNKRLPRSLGRNLFVLGRGPSWGCPVTSQSLFVSEPLDMMCHDQGKVRNSEKEKKNIQASPNTLTTPSPNTHTEY